MKMLKLTETTGNVALFSLEGARRVYRSTFDAPNPLKNQVWHTRIAYEDGEVYIVTETPEEIAAMVEGRPKIIDTDESRKIYERIWKETVDLHPSVLQQRLHEWMVMYGYQKP